MEASWIIVSFIAVLVMIFVFRQNKKDVKVDRKDLKRASNF